MDEKFKTKRGKTTGQTDDQLAQKYMDEVAKRFKNGKLICYVFLNGCYGQEKKIHRRKGASTKPWKSQES